MQKKNEMFGHGGGSQLEPFEEEKETGDGQVGEGQRDRGLAHGQHTEHVHGQRQEGEDDLAEQMRFCRDIKGMVMDKTKMRHSSTYFDLAAGRRPARGRHCSCSVVAHRAPAEIH